MAKKIDYETTVELPSKGLIYKEDKIPASITLRGMTTREEKILYAGTGSDSFQRVLENCIIQPENIDTSKLISADEMFLIVQLRILTYGPEYKVVATCPNCGRKETYTINLAEFDVNTLPDDFKEPIKIELPKSGDILEARLLRNYDTKEIDRYSRKFAKQFNQNVREVEYVCRMAKYITTINGESVDFVQAREYVEDMYSMDTAKFWSVINKIDVGMDSTCYVTCDGCKEDFDFNMPVTSEFFRPVIE